MEVCTPHTPKMDAEQTTSVCEPTSSQNDLENRKHISKYIKCIPENEKNNTKLNIKLNRSRMKTILLNGNMSTCVRVSNKKYFVINTCSFDSIAAMISMAYLDHNQYKKYIDSVSNDFLTFCKNIAKKGTTRQTYVSRLLLLKTIFSTDKGITEVKLIDAKCNVLHIITQLLKNTPSATERRICSNTKCMNAKDTMKFSPTIILKFSYDFENLERSLVDYTAPMFSECSVCHGILTSRRTLNKHLFIETDFFNNEEFALTDFPQTCKINNSR
ncbi:Hypothetical protein CINCED_3A005355 [Cinara cedri]|uniref:Uncharacterized protein n=1 Tax=Cinara cedri TaxID=506608 RepID=A0A5E4NC72_9HEMI|nr:Hypothetical protein CINCED_3A005355 [Cinara cedri]